MDLLIETLPWYHRRHHRAGGFQNLDKHQRPASLWKGLTWAARRVFHGKAHTPPPVHRPDTLALRRRPRGDAQERVRITWLGHSTSLIQTPGFTVLTDPVFSDRASPVSFAGPYRLAPPALTVRDLPPLDAVVLSHDHYDHCDQASIEAIYRRFEPVFFVPLGVAARLRTWGVGPVVELDWWQRASFRPAADRPGTDRSDGPPGPLRLTCLPARHFSGRSLLDRNSTLWASWMIEAPAAASAPTADHAAENEGVGGDGRIASNGSTLLHNPPEDAGSPEQVRVYFGGDTGCGSHFKEIRARIGAPDAAILPIGAFQPRALMAPVHIGPGEAVRAFKTLGAEHLVPIHWGTFDLAEETVQAPGELLKNIAARQDLTDRIHIPNPGEVLSLGSERTEHAERSEVPSLEVDRSA